MLMIAIVKIRQVKTTVFAHSQGLMDLFRAHLPPELRLVHPSCWSELMNSYTFSGRNHQWELTFSSQILASMVETANESCDSFSFRKIFLFPHNPTVSSRIMCLCCRQTLRWRAVIGISLSGTFYRADQVFFCMVLCQPEPCISFS